MFARSIDPIIIGHGYDASSGPWGWSIGIDRRPFEHVKCTQSWPSMDTTTSSSQWQRGPCLPVSAGLVLHFLATTPTGLLAVSKAFKRPSINAPHRFHHGCCQTIEYNKKETCSTQYSIFGCLRRGTKEKAIYLSDRR
jgi:hypothetical protein